MKKTKEYLMLICAVLIFGFNGVIVHNISLTSAEIVFFRTVLGSLSLLAVLAVKKDFSFGALKADMPYNIFAGICLGLNWVFLFEAYREASVSIATLIYYCGPMIVVLLSPVLFREKLTGKTIFCLILVAIGLILTTGVSGGAQGKGLAYAFASAVLYACIVICSKKVTHMNGMNLAFTEICISFVVMLIYLPLTGIRLPVIPSSGDLPWILLIGVVNTGLAYYLYFSSIQALPAQTASVISYIDPLSALLFAVLLIPGENMSAIQVLGAVLILGGAVLSEIKIGKR